MSGPNPPDKDAGGQSSDDPTAEYRDDRDELTDTGFQRAYSAPESEQYTIGPYLPPDLELYDYDAYDDRLSADAYLDWSKKWMREIVRVLRPDGTFWLAIGDEYAAELKVIATRVQSASPVTGLVAC